MKNNNRACSYCCLLSSWPFPIREKGFVVLVGQVIWVILVFRHWNCFLRSFGMFFQFVGD